MDPESVPLWKIFSVVKAEASKEPELHWGGGGAQWAQ
jgi:hypothetical protein